MSSAFEDARRVSVNGTTLAYREHGDGEPVVFVHGAVSDLRTWTAQLDGIGEGHRAVAYSGRYARPDGDLPFASDTPMLAHVDTPMLAHVEDLAAFLSAIDASPAHLMGHSSGGLICLLMAIRHPDLVRTLMLEEPTVMTLFVSPKPRLPELLELLVRRPRTAAAIVKMGITALGPAEKAFRRGDDDAGMLAFLRGVVGRKHLKRVSEARRQQARENLSELKATLVGAGLPQISDDEVRGVAMRTLLLTGEHSPMFSLCLTDRVEELLPRATRVEIPDASHFAHEDNPRAVNEAILTFLDRAASEDPPADKPAVGCPAQRERNGHFR